jgi:hypothetical protein
MLDRGSDDVRHEPTEDSPANPLEDYLPLIDVRSLAEAERLAVVLENAGIPAVVQGVGTSPITAISFADPRICVPRHLLKRARVILNDQPSLEGETASLRESKSSVRKSAETLALGIEWLFYPWLFLIRERLSFSLFEFWLTTIVCGASIGFMMNGFAHIQAPFWLYVFVMYIIIHCYCVALLGAVYELRKRERKAPMSGRRRLALIAIFQMPLLLAFAATGIMLQIQ